MPGAFDDLIPGRAPGGLAPITIGTPRVDPSKVATQRGTEVRTATDVATLPYAGPKAAADARKADAEAALLERKLANPETPDKPALTPAQQASIDALRLDDVLAAVDQASGLVRTGKATGYTGALGRTFGMGTPANDLSATLSTIGSFVTMDTLKSLKEASSTGASGLGVLSDREGQMLRDSIASIGLRQSDPKLLDSLARIRRSALSLKAIRAGQNPDDKAVQQQFGIVAGNENAKPPAAGLDRSQPIPSGPGGSGPLIPSQSGFKSAPDPLTAGIKQRLSDMVRTGATQDQINSYTDSVGIPRADATEPIKFRTKNPKYQGGYDVISVQKSVPMSPTEQFATGLINAKVGGFSPAAAVIGSADTLSGGTVDNIGGMFGADPERTRAYMEGVQQQSPMSSLIGQVGGGVAAGLGVTGAASRLGAGGLASMIAGDVVPMAAYGAGSADGENDNRILGGLAGAAIGGVSGVAGRGMGAMISGTANGAVQRLADRGIRMTPGQLFGGAAKGVEDAATSWPLVGGLIRNQRRTGYKDLNVAGFDEGLAPIGASTGGEIAERGAGLADDAIADAYDRALNGRSATIDQQFGQDLAGAVNTMQRIPRAGPEVADTISHIVPPYFSPSGQLTGENLQPLLRELRDTRQAYRMDALGNRVGNSVRDVEGAVTGMFGRQAPEVMPQLNAANEAFANVSTIDDAILAAANTGGVYSPAQLGNAAKANAKRFQGKNAAARGERAFFQLQRDAQEVLPSTMPDSGTAGRLMLPGALGLAGGGVGGAKGFAMGTEEGALGDAGEGAGVGAMTGMAAGAAVVSPYALRALLQRALTARRPQQLVPLGRAIGQARLPGALAIPLLEGGN